MLVDLVEGLRQQVARLEVDLVDGVFQRADGLQQVGVLRIEEGLALARLRQLVQRRQVDGAQRGDLLLDAVDLGLQAPQLDGAFLDRRGQRVQVGLGGLQLLQVLRAAQLRGLQLRAAAW
jgi:hypothetical protein